MLQQTAHPFSISAARNFGASGRDGAIHRFAPARLPAARAMWQALHAEASGLADFARILVLAATAEELADVDFAALGCVTSIVLDASTKTVQGSTPCIRANFGDAAALAQLDAALSAESGPVLLVVGGVLEYTADPRPLLAWLRRCLKCHEGNRLLLATLGRTPALEPLHRRMWSAREAAAMLDAACFETLEQSGSRFTLRCSAASHPEVLARHGLPAAAERLLVVGEHAPAAREGAIVLCTGNPGVKPWLAADRISPCSDPAAAPEHLLDAVLHLVFLYDGLSEIEYADLGGECFRVAQAKQTGLIPPAIRTTVVCQGSSAYRERQRGAFDPPELNVRHVREKIAFELADQVIYRTAALRDFYEREMGLRPIGERVVGPAAERPAAPLPRSCPLVTDMAVTVVVPVFNRPIAEIADLIVGINAQFLRPREVIFVDDGSADDFAAAHAATITGSLACPARFIRHVRNLGLSAARNTGLAACETPFIVVHDSDNIASNDFLYRGCRTLAAHPEFDAVTCFNENFRDGADWTRHDPARFRFKPLGDGLVDSLGWYNRFGDALAVYRTEALRAIGGWDERNRVMWEDMILFMALASAGRRVITAPLVDVLYRTRPDSMLRTASEFGARWHMARALRGLTMFEALCLQRVLWAGLHGHPLAPPPYTGRQHLRAASVLLVRRMPGPLSKRLRWAYRALRKRWKA